MISAQGLATFNALTEADYACTLQRKLANDAVIGCENRYSLKSSVCTTPPIMEDKAAMPQRFLVEGEALSTHLSLYCSWPLLRVLC